MTSAERNRAKDIIRQVQDSIVDKLPDLVDALYDIAISDEAPARDRVSAASYLMNRVMGTPTERMEVGGAGDFSYERMLEELRQERLPIVDGTVRLLEEGLSEREVQEPVRDFSGDGEAGEGAEGDRDSEGEGIPREEGSRGDDEALRRAAEYSAGGAEDGEDAGATAADGVYNEYSGADERHIPVDHPVAVALDWRGLPLPDADAGGVQKGVEDADGQRAAKRGRKAARPLPTRPIVRLIDAYEAGEA